MYSNSILSIITPNYNSFYLMSKWIERYRKVNNPQIEWVVVDDCSTDDSYQQLLRFRDENPELNVSIYQSEKNSGPGVTRNLGVQKAKGEYLTFLDSDDFFDDSFWLVVKPEMQKNRDCIIFDSCFYYDDEHQRGWPIFRNGQLEGVVTTEEAIVHVIGAPWGKIYRRDIIIDNHVTFLAQKRNEDLPFTKHALSCCKDIIYIKQPLYYYVQQENSLIHDATLTNFSNTINAFSYIRENIELRYPCEVEALFVSVYLYALALQSYKSLPKKEYFQALREAEQMFPEYYSNPYLKYSTLQQKLVIACVRHKLYFGIQLVLWLQKLRNRRLYRTR